MIRFALWQFALVALMAAICTILGAAGPVGLMLFPVVWLPLILTNALKPRKAIR